MAVHPIYSFWSLSDFCLLFREPANKVEEKMMLPDKNHNSLPDADR
jgi:hypothetical protein